MFSVVFSLRHLLDEYLFLIHFWGSIKGLKKRLPFEPVNRSSIRLY